MKTKTIKEPVYKTEQIKVGEKDKVVYIAIDGREFITENECIEYERKTCLIKDGEEFIKKIELDSSIAEIITMLIFNGYSASSINFFKWKATKNEKIIEKVSSYLCAKHCPINLSELEKFNEGDNVLISSWTESENSDYPSYKTKAIGCEDAIKIIDETSTIMKSVFN